MAAEANCGDFGFLVIVNLAVWLLAVTAFAHQPVLLGLALLAWVVGVFALCWLVSALAYRWQGLHRVGVE